MSYLLKSNRPPQRKKFLPVFAVSFLLILFLLLHFLAPGFLSTRLQAFTFPVFISRLFVIQKAGDILSVFYFNSYLTERINSLENDLQAKNIESIEKRAFKKENDDLKRQLGIYSEKNPTLAALVLRPPQSFYDSFLIDQGRNANIEVGSGVFVGEKILIGEIVEVYTHSSKVKLYSTASEETQVTVGKNSFVSKLVGKGGGNFELEIPTDIASEIGDLIFLSGREPYLLAVVGAIETNPNDSFETILARLPINIFELQWVRIGEKLVQPIGQ